MPIHSNACYRDRILIRGRIVRILESMLEKLIVSGVPNIDTMNSPSLLRPISKEKLFVLGQLDTNEDVLRTLLSFCLYDLQTATTLNFQKIQKSQMCRLITSAMSRSTCEFGNHWAFGFPNMYSEERNGDLLPLEENLQLQATNCDRCGKYQFHVQTQPYVPRVIMCACV